jgi:hypothetical protein
MQPVPVPVLVLVLVALHYVQMWFAAAQWLWVRVPSCRRIGARKRLLRLHHVAPAAGGHCRKPALCALTDLVRMANPTRIYHDNMDIEMRSVLGGTEEEPDYHDNVGISEDAATTQPLAQKPTARREGGDDPTGVDANAGVPDARAAGGPLRASNRRHHTGGAGADAATAAGAARLLSACDGFGTITSLAFVYAGFGGDVEGDAEHDAKA